MSLAPNRIPNDTRYSFFVIGYYECVCSKCQDSEYPERASFEALSSEGDQVDEMAINAGWKQVTFATPEYWIAPGHENDFWVARVKVIRP